MRKKKTVLLFGLFISLTLLVAKNNFLKAEDYSSQDIEYLKKALQISPDNFGSYYGLGLAYFRKGDYHMTIDCHEKFIGLFNPDSQQTARNLEIAYQRLGYAKTGIQSSPASYDEKEIEALTRALAINPQIAQIYVYLIGLSPVSQAILNEEIQYLEKAYNSNPDNFGTILALIVAYYRRQDYDKALQYLSEFTILNPDCSLTHRGLAIAYYKKGDINNALSQVSQLRQLGYNDLVRELEGMGIVRDEEIR